ncbi:MAG: hypothetical protein EA379_06765 [Phycisphaerales bacterium]|nr:MAG: hypothetical protein EA379_06765 [Phycisphaerales bacterium]
MKIKQPQTHVSAARRSGVLARLALAGAWILSAPALATDAPDPRRPLSAEGAVSVAALAKAMSLVRFFHPSDVAIRLDWAEFAVNGVLAVEDAATPEERRKTLSKLFGTVAPGGHFFLSEEDAPEIELIRTEPDNQIVGVLTADHVGFGEFGGVGIFHRARLFTALEAGRALRGFPDPMTPWVADLGGGVSLSLPITLWASTKGQSLPAATHEADAVVPRPLLTAPRDEVRRAVRIGSVVVAWGALRHFHPWSTLENDGWNAALNESIALAATTDHEDPAAMLRPVQRLLAHVGDAQAHIELHMAPAMFAPPLSWAWIDGELIISNTPEGADTRVARGDVVVEIDGVPAAEAIEIAAAFAPGATDRLRRALALDDIALGARGSEIALVVRSESGEERPVRLTRTEPPSTLAPSRRGPVEEVAPGVLYINTAVLDESAIIDAIHRATGKRGLIIDYRAADDGALGEQLGMLLHDTEAAWPARTWIPTPRRPDRVDLAFEQHEGILISRPPEIDARVVFLTDVRTLGQAEADLVPVRGYDLGVIIGERTGGSPGRWLAEEWLPSGHWLRWTGVLVRDGDGETISGTGIAPDVDAIVTRAGVLAGRDEALELALELIDR